MTGFPKPEPRAKTQARKAREDATRARAFREAVWMRCGPWCSRCGCSVSHPGDGDGLQWGHVHHIRPRSLSQREKFDPANGILLCASCHAGVHAGTVTLP